MWWGTQNFRPDLVIQKGRDILIIDVTVPFDNGLESFKEARRIKEVKYRDLAIELSVGGKNAVVQAIVVGVLGSWDLDNNKTIRRLCSRGMTK